tara:strand:- start:1803 stop:3551 length:1749 start_codon:yes stop_codon:yes gene_type:complete
MSKSANQPLEHAEEIIERFGGIRPMASKIDVAVTTIQGWKKRGVIPANRKNNIISSAQEHDIDLSDLIEGLSPPANQDIPEEQREDEALQTEQEAPEKTLEASKGENEDIAEDIEESEESETIEAGEDDTQEEEAQVEVDEGEADEDTQEESEEIRVKTTDFEIKTRAQKNPDHQENEQDFTEIAIETEKRAVTKSAVVTFAVILVVLIAVVMILMPKMDQVDNHGQRITSLEGEMINVQQEQSMFKGLVPRDWSKQLEDLKKQVANAQQAAAPAIQTIQDVSGDLMGGNTEAIQDRVVQLESYVSEMTESTSLSGLMDRLNGMSKTMVGQEVIGQSMQDLNAVFASLGQAEGQDGQKVNGLLDMARQQSAALGQTFENVPQKDLQAAAMLLAMSQMRTTLARNEESFDGDLQLLMNMVPEENVELRESLARLAPYAKDGVLSSNALSNEFRGLAGDVVASSLSGEDVSLMDKARARMNNLLAIEKDGELITGTETQATLSKAQNQIDQGNVEGAISLLQTNLAPAELKNLSGWIDKAQGFVSARNAKKLIEDTINMNLGSGYLGGTSTLSEGRSRIKGKTY